MNSLANRAQKIINEKNKIIADLAKQRDSLQGDLAALTSEDSSLEPLARKRKKDDS